MFTVPFNSYVIKRLAMTTPGFKNDKNTFKICGYGSSHSGRAIISRREKQSNVFQKDFGSF